MLRKIKNIFKKQEESYVKVPFDELEVGDVFRLESSQFDHEEQIRVGCEDMYNYIWAYNLCFRPLMVMGFNENGDIEIRDSPIHMVGYEGRVLKQYIFFNRKPEYVLMEKRKSLD